MLETDYGRPEVSPFGRLGEPIAVQGSKDPELLGPRKSPRDEIVRQAKLLGVPHNIALAVAQHRSQLRQPARAQNGAAGLFLVSEDDARRLNVNPTDWRQNVRGGVTLLRRARDEAGSWAEALGGEHEPVRKLVHELQKGRLLSRGDSGIIHLSAPLPTRPTYLADFGPRKAPSDSRGDFHTGVDIAAPAGTPVAALTGGRAVFAGEAPGAGGSVVVRDNGGRYWAYAHLSGITSGLKAGNVVRPGDPLGAVGSTGFSTGNHLHVGVVLKGKWVNPVQVLQRAFGAGWGESRRDTIADSDFNPPDHGGARVGGLGQAETPDAYSITGEPTTEGSWRHILMSGPTSPEIQHLAEQHGVTL